MRNRSLGVALGLSLLASGAANAGYSIGTMKSYTLPTSAWDAQIGDVTGDGRNDVVVLTSDSGISKLHVFAQKSDGTLANPPRVYGLPDNARSLAMGDLNRDGIQDLAVGGRGSMTILLSDVAAPVPLRVTTWTTNVNAFNIGLAKVDRDEFLDIVAVNGLVVPVTPISYFRGDGKGGIQPDALLLSRVNAFTTESHLEIADVDGNGTDDVITTQNGVVRILYNNNGHDFSRTETIDPGFAVTKASARDINGDRRPDLIVTGGSSPQLLYVYYQQASGERFPQGDVALELSNPQWGLASDPFVVHDFDHDGDADLLSLHRGGSASLGLFTNDGQGLGAEVLQTSGIGEPTHVAAGDVNGDGCTDVVVTGYYSLFAVFPGSGCAVSAPPPRPDLALELSTNQTSATVKLATIFSTLSVNEPLVEIAFSLTQGSFQLGSLPPNCVVHSQSSNKARVDCLVTTMGPSTVKQLSIPVQVAVPEGLRAHLGVSARALTDTDEVSKTNNMATQVVGFSPTLPAEQLVTPLRTANTRSVQDRRTLRISSKEVVQAR